MTEYGPVRGTREPGIVVGMLLRIAHDTRQAFYGIPFAQPPVGPLRFHAPVVPQPWTDALNCTTQDVNRVSM